MSAPIAAGPRTVRNYSILVRDLDDGSGAIMLALAETTWRPGQGPASKHFTMEWVQEHQLQGRLTELVRCLRELHRSNPEQSALF